jgi:hypothetical protein
MLYPRFETNTHTQINVVTLKNAVKRLRIYNIVQNDKISFLHDASQHWNWENSGFVSTNKGNHNGHIFL